MMERWIKEFRAEKFLLFGHARVQLQSKNTFIHKTGCAMLFCTIRSLNPKNTGQHHYKSYIRAYAKKTRKQRQGER